MSLTEEYDNNMPETPMSMSNDLDGIEVSNILHSKRKRRATVRYEDELFQSDEYRKLMLCDIPDEEMEAALVDSDISTDASDDDELEGDSGDEGESGDDGFLEDEEEEEDEDGDYEDDEDDDEEEESDYDEDEDEVEMEESDADLDLDDEVESEPALARKKSAGDLSSLSNHLSTGNKQPCKMKKMGQMGQMNQVEEMDKLGHNNAPILPTEA